MTDTLLTAAEPPPPPPTASFRSSRWMRLLSDILYPVASFGAFLLIWQFLPRALGVANYILPVPTEFFANFFTNWALIREHTLITSQEIAAGFIAGTIISVPLGYLITSQRVVERAFYPLIVFFQLVPKIAVAPLFVVWFGFGLMPKVLLTFLLCFFPVLVSSMAGFRSLDERVLYLTRSMGATAYQTFRYVRLPTALPFILAGMRVSVVLATTGAIVAEFVGANQGLGYLLLQGTTYLDMPRIFACLLALCLVGLLFAYAVGLLERFMMPWKPKK